MIDVVYGDHKEIHDNEKKLVLNAPKVCVFSILMMLDIGVLYKLVFSFYKLYQFSKFHKKPLFA